MEIWDSFVVFNEPEELLRLRFETLAGVVSRFVVVVPDRTNTGLPWTPLFDANRFSGFPVEVLPCSPPLEGTPATRDVYVRNYARQRLLQGDPGDLVVVSEADCWPRPDILAQVTDWPGVTVFHDRLFVWFLNLEFPACTEACVAIRRGALAEVEPARAVQKSGGHGAELGAQVQHVVGGWHFCNMGGPERAHLKLRAYAEAEDETVRRYSGLASLREAYRNREWWIGPWNWRGVIVPLDASMPEPLRRDPSRWEALLLDSPSGRALWGCPGPASLPGSLASAKLPTRGCLP